ncbi:MAG: hypothetical protein IPH26_03540 [Sterolibacteriaceae bacterium]|uniref:Uncharacterized protein n=1 Tax=Candidatus Methylophosphatis roskildensis TaxID=2899263 RepID=A0A9D7HKL3_9PROT|nr:hypothetical protein [Candidatus Methylophosphatis roskildensis]
MLGLANAQADPGDAKAAKATLQSLLRNYPSNNAARVAKRLAKRRTGRSRTRMRRNQRSSIAMRPGKARRRRRGCA